MNDYYLAGLIDGEASFIVMIVRDNRYRVGYRVKTKFTLPQKEKQLLDIVREYLGFGKIYWHRRDELWYYEVHSRKELFMLCNRICNKLIIKRDKCLKFRQIIALLLYKKHYTPEIITIIKKAWTTPETGANPR